jgi:hypothetical protein
MQFINSICFYSQILYYRVTQSDDNPLVEISTPAISVNLKVRRTEEKKTLTMLQVRVFFHKVSLTLNGGGKHFAKSEMIDLQVVTSVTPTSLTASVTPLPFLALS